MKTPNILLGLLASLLTADDLRRWSPPTSRRRRGRLRGSLRREGSK